MSVIHSKFTGKLTLLTTSPLFREKIIPDFTFDATFDTGGSWLLPKGSFHHVEKDIVTPGGKVDLHVTLDNDGLGKWSPQDLGIHVVFEFDVNSGAIEKHSRLDVQFDTGERGGNGGLRKITGLKPVEATGKAGLVGSGKFKGSLLKNATCLVHLEGTFTPNPWAA